MRWSYADFLETPDPVVDEVVAWMKDQAEAEARRQREDEAKRRKR